jgi:2-polyprenyl-3-methyl-5-hydroxy-6-metoxy-1,4-benzoquinol methylase
MMNRLRALLRGSRLSAISPPSSLAAAEYKYNATDDHLDLWAANFTSRLDDGQGNHEQAYLDALKLIFELKREGALLEIGSGFGRIVELAIGRVSRVVGLEPDLDRFSLCRDRYHRPPRCSIHHQMSREYMLEHPGAQFEVVLLSMVLQHVSTVACTDLMDDAHKLVKPEGIVVIATTHTIESAKGFSTSGADDSEVYLDRSAYDAYASQPKTQTKGIPVRRFSRRELEALLSPKFDILHWQQFSYYRPSKIEWFAKRLGVDANELKDTGDSQFVVLRKKDV